QRPAVMTTTEAEHGRFLSGWRLHHVPSAGLGGRPRTTRTGAGDARPVAPDGAGAAGVVVGVRRPGAAADHRGAEGGALPEAGGAVARQGRPRPVRSR